MLTTRLGIAVGASVLALSLAPVAAHAIDGGGGGATITASLLPNIIGSRSVTAVNPIALNSLAGSTTLSAPYAVTVTEATRSGTNPWSVSADVSVLTSGPYTIPRSAVSVSGRAVVQTLGGGVASAPAGPSQFGPVTLFSDSAQDLLTLYSGTYTATGTIVLAPPDGSRTGVYSATFSVTLVQ